MKRYWSLFVAILSVVVVFSQSKEEKNILIVHSYHQGLEWTDNITEGISSVFSERHEYQLFYEYLDTKRNTSEDYMKQLADLFELKMQEMEFSAVIASDNASYIFVSEYAKKAFKDIPLVFCGINNAHNIIESIPDNAYILAENADHAATLRLAHSLMPTIDTILIVNDNTLTGRLIQDELRDVLPLFNNQFVFEFFSDFTLEELEHRVSTLGASSGIYLLVVNKDRLGNFISYRMGIASVQQNTHVPIFGSWDFYMNRGIVGGAVTSGKIQGESAARLLLQLMEDSSGFVCAQVTDVPNSYQFDIRELERFEIDLSLLPQGSILLNAPPEESFRKPFYLLLVVFLFVVLVFSVIIYFKKRRRIYLEKMIDEKTYALQDIIKKKDQFFSILAHDLRSPLGNMVEVNRLIVNKGDDYPADRRYLLQKEVFDTSVKVFNLLEDLLVWGRFQFKKQFAVMKDEVLLNTLLNEIDSLFSYKGQSSRLQFFLDKSFRMNTDVFILKFVLRNLVQNALKFSEEDTTVDIGANWEGSDAVIWVKDYGVGMSQEVIDSIYNKNPIQASGIKGQQSFGLGLTSVVELLSCLGGELSIQSKEGRGSTFFVKLSGAMM